MNDISMVVPTWNEEDWLPRLLGDICRSPLVREVVVADNNSTDRTVEIAREYGCKVVEGGTPAIGRNVGATNSTGSILLFVDADTVVTSQVLSAIRMDLSKSDVVAVHFRVQAITENHLYRFCYWIMNSYFRVLSIAGLHQGIGNLIAVRRNAFNSIGGFNEEIMAAEDLDFIRRVGKAGKVKYEHKQSVLSSCRRLYAENAIAIVGKCVIWTLLRLMGSTRSLFAYSWKRHNSELAKRETMILQKWSDLGWIGGLNEHPKP